MCQLEPRVEKRFDGGVVLATWFDHGLVKFEGLFQKSRDQWASELVGVGPPRGGMNQLAVPGRVPDGCWYRWQAKSSAAYSYSNRV